MTKTENAMWQRLRINFGAILEHRRHDLAIEPLMASVVLPMKNEAAARQACELANKPTKTMAIRHATVRSLSIVMDMNGIDDEDLRLSAQVIKVDGRWCLLVVLSHTKTATRKAAGHARSR